MRDIHRERITADSGSPFFVRYPDIYGERVIIDKNANGGKKKQYKTYKWNCYIYHNIAIKYGFYTISPILDL